MTIKTVYKKLKGPRSGLQLSYNRDSLWQADDHLLLVQKTGYSETYKKFHFKDLEAVIIRKTASFKIIIVFNAILISGLAILALYIDDDGGQIAISCIALFFAFILLIHCLKGASCKCFFKTRVQTTNISSLGRIKAARKVLRGIQPFLDAAQGQLDRETLNEPENVAKISAIQNDQTMRAPTHPSRFNTYRGKWHIWLAVTLVITGICSLAFLIQQSLSVITFTLLVNAALVILFLLALTQQKRSTLTQAAKKSTYWALGLEMATSINAYVLFIIVVMKSAVKSGSSLSTHDPIFMLKAYADIDINNSSYTYLSHLIGGVWPLIAGLAIYISTRQSRKRKTNEPTPPPIPQSLPSTPPPLSSPSTHVEE